MATEGRRPGPGRSSEVVNQLHSFAIPALVGT